MPRPPALPPEEKVAIVLAVLAGDITAAEAARTAGVTDQAIYNWKRRFVTAGRNGLETGLDQSSQREQQLLGQVAELKRALGDSYLQMQTIQNSIRARASMPGTARSGNVMLRTRRP
ncbi:helix-turn-helix domain-containing protein (plasmid) [Streptomyces sp. NBC_01558]|uniref:helix-turn-helix domain-containing protein n=1 Tax=unclassified Streptomyces TaxID=2593676 RepID=UPI002DD8C818|nr:helix-turn-helix domain-containing protein [Streptomyces sp. NBC_01558]WSD82748.1 helix-turn-helix domain-containing protein [Streptomyces sp. NBC_01558]